MSVIIELKSPEISQNDEFINKYFKVEDGYSIESKDQYFTVIHHEYDGRETWINIGLGLLSTQNTPNDQVLSNLELISKDIKAEFYVDGEIVDIETSNGENVKGCFPVILILIMFGFLVNKI